MIELCKIQYYIGRDYKSFGTVLKQMPVYNYCIRVKKLADVTAVCGLPIVNSQPCQTRITNSHRAAVSVNQQAGQPNCSTHEQIY